MEVVTINTDRREPFVKLRAALADPRPALERIGEIMEAEALAAFDDQAWNGEPWAPRYPNMAEPFINIAGALADFSSGRTEPKERRYARTPANIDTGALSNSPRSRVSGRRTVELGSTHPAAAIANYGLVSHQEVDDATKNSIARWILKQKKGSPERARAERLLPLLKPNLTGWDTEVVARPFLGVSEQAEKDIKRAVEEEIAGAANGERE